MPAFENADAAFAAGAPLLKLFEPTLLLPLLARRAFGVVTRNGDSFDPQLRGLGFVSGGEESGVRRHALRSPTELFDMFPQTSFQQSGIGRPQFAHLEMRDDLVLGLLNQTSLPNSLGLCAGVRQIRK